MKSLIFTLSLVLTSLVASAQCTPLPQPDGGIYPAGDTAHCFVRGVADSAVVYFKNYDQVPVGSITADVDSIRIDSINGLPCGLAWTTSNAANGNVFAKNEIGCFLIYGTSEGIEGVFKTNIVVTAWIVGGPATGIQQPASVIGLGLSVKSINAGTSCSAVTDTITNLSTACVPVGINEVAANLTAISCQPNPFNSFTNIKFTAKENAVYTLKVVNMLGAVVYQEQVSAEPGVNNIRMERNNLPAGVYVYSISNGMHSINNRMMIGE